LEQVANLLKFAVIGGLVDGILLRESTGTQDQEGNDEREAFHDPILSINAG
jgi:hypothetical protein